MMPASRLNRILEGLKKNCPYAKTRLKHRNPFELLISTILSAQCTDVRVNIVTKELFKKYKNPSDYVRAGILKIEKEIKTCGLYHNKAKSIVGSCRMLKGDFGGKVPVTRDGLMRLPGVGRKTANVVLSNAFGVDAIAVDTHVFRVANRIGLTKAKTPEETERQLMAIISKKLWSLSHHWIIHHGRTVCKAIHPKCNICDIKTDCDFIRENS